MLGTADEKIKLLKKISKGLPAETKEDTKEESKEETSETTNKIDPNANTKKKPEVRKLKSIIQDKIIHPEQLKKKKEEEEEEYETMELEFDSYVYLGVILPDFILIFYKIMSGMLPKIFQKNQSLSFFNILRYLFTRITRICLFSLVLLPGLLVPFIQIVVIGSFDKGNLDLDLIDHEKILFSVAKIFMIFMFSCMALKECSNALKNWLHTIFYMKRLEKYTSLLAALESKEKKINRGFKISYYASKVASFLPGLSQLSVSLFIQNYSTYIIVNCQTCVDLIANFAGLYVILEFDNLMIDFLKTSYLDQAMVKLVKYVMVVMKEFISEGDLLLDLEKSMKKMFESDSIEIKEQKAKKYGIQWIFPAHKIMIWIVIFLQFFVVAITFH